jgi:glycosyltransferase involved in cell wall biosynthesis
MKAIQKIVDDCDIDILHVYRSGFAEFPEPNIDVVVKCFVETNVFGMLDPNPAINSSLFMSEWLMHDTCKKLGFKHNRFDFVNNPVELPKTKTTIPVFPDADQNTIILGRCGRPDNGIYNAINVNAAAVLRQWGYDVRFLVVAPPPNMVFDLERLQIPFAIVNPTVDPLVLSSFYNTVDIYAHARADGETFGVNIAEAMIHSKPVVTHIATPSCPGMGVFQAQTELVDSGVTGFVVQNDLQEYADALKKLIDSRQLRDSMGLESYRKALKEYHVGPCLDKLERIYNEVSNTS